MDDFGNETYLALETDGFVLRRVMPDVLFWSVLYFFGLQYDPDPYGDERIFLCDNVL